MWFAKTYGFFDGVDPLIVEWMARHGVGLTRVSLGIVFLWFGALKFFSDMSLAQELAGRTIAGLQLPREHRCKDSF